MSYVMRPLIVEENTYHYVFRNNFKNIDSMILIEKIMYYIASAEFGGKI